MKNEMLALILAGGQGTRLGKLTQNIAKPAVQFGGRYNPILLVKEIVGLKELAMRSSKISTISIASIRNMFSSFLETISTRWTTMTCFNLTKITMLV